MLNPAGYRILSDPDRLTIYATRLLLRLLCDFDLTRFRALSLERLQELYIAPPNEIRNAIRDLVSIGLLEEGPQGTLPGVRGKLMTYRIRPAYRLSPEDLRKHFAEVQAMEEREFLLQPIKKGTRTIT